MTLPLCLHQYLRRVEALEKEPVKLPFGRNAPVPARGLTPVPVRPLMR
jgi:hypothetical protein